VKARHIVLVALAATVTLVSVAAARPDAAVQRVEIATTGVLSQGALAPSGFGEFVLSVRRTGVVERDSGIVTSVWRAVRMRLGRRVVVYDAVSTLTGKRGSIVIGERVEWVDDGAGAHPGQGVWDVLHGTGQYAWLAGGGRSGIVWSDRGPWSSRYDGVLALSRDRGTSPAGPAFRSGCCRAEIALKRSAPTIDFRHEAERSQS
jgi:hypothetical protein